MLNSAILRKSVHHLMHVGQL